MMKSSEYYLVRKDMLPDVLRKVMDVKRLIDSGERVRQCGLSFDWH